MATLLLPTLQYRPWLMRDVEDYFEKTKKTDRKKLEALWSQILKMPTVYIDLRDVTDLILKAVTNLQLDETLGAILAAHMLRLDCFDETQKNQLLMRLKSFSLYSVAKVRY